MITIDSVEIIGSSYYSGSSFMNIIADNIIINNITIHDIGYNKPISIGSFANITNNE
jgi:hypothetical protein